MMIIKNWGINSIYYPNIDVCSGARSVINVATSMEVGPLFQALKFVRLNHRYNQERGFSDFRKILVEVFSGDPYS